MHINTYILIVAILSFYRKNIYNNKLIGSICVQVVSIIRYTSIEYIQYLYSIYLIGG